MAGKHLKDWRARIRSFQVESPAKQYLHAIGISVEQPQVRALRCSGSGRCSWPPPAGRAVRVGGDIVRAGWIAGQELALSGPKVPNWISGTSTANHKEHKAHKERTKTGLPVFAAPPGESRARPLPAARLRRSARRDAERAGEVVGFRGTGSAITVAIARRVGYPLLPTQRATLCAARLQAAVRGRRLRAGPSGLAAMSSGRAGLNRRAIKGGLGGRSGQMSGGAGIR